MREEVRASLRRLVRERARGRCEYCWMPDDEPFHTNPTISLL